MAKQNREQFLNLLKPVRRQLLFAAAMKELQLLLFYGGASILIVLLLARTVVITDLPVYLFAAALASLSFSFWRFWIRKPGFREAAAVYNRFVPDDRVLTAYSLLNSEGLMELLQLEEALAYMKRDQASVLKRKKQFFYPKWFLGALAVLLAVSAAAFLPSTKMERASQLDEEKEIVESAEKQLNEKAEKEKNPETRKLIEETAEEISKLDSAAEALKELEKKNKSLELQKMKEQERQRKLEETKSRLDNAGLSSLAAALDNKDLNKAMDELKELQKNLEELSDKQKEALQELAQKDGPLTDEELDKLAQQLEQALNSSDALSRLAAAQQAVGQAGTKLHSQMSANGMNPGQLALSGSTGQPAPGQSPGQSTGTGAQQPGKGNAGNGSGSGSGTGSGTGSGSGSGSGSGGSGSGSGGMGSGAGLGQGSRELLTVPERITGQVNTETDSGQLGDGGPAGQSEGAGPILRGSARPYSEVYESYERSYRESSERYKLPDELAEIVKNYFTNIDPDGE